MTTSITNRPAPAWLRELADGRATYEELLGWPVAVGVGERVLTVAIGRVLDAVTMPAELGTRVRAELGIAMLAAPVVADPASGRWTFLTGPLDRLRPAVPSDLVTVVPHGEHVVIPVDPHAVSGQLCWVEPPRSARALPPADAVIGTTCRLAAQHHHLAA